MSLFSSFLSNTWIILLDAAPWLLLGLLASAFIWLWVPVTTMTRWLGGRGSGPIIKAALIGTPLPLCSCGVLPAAKSLRQQGASRGATISFLIATPENGIDSIAISYAMLGPLLTIVRPVAAIFSAILAGLSAEIFGRDSCSTSIAVTCADDGCSDSIDGITASTAPPPTTWRRLRRGISYAFTDILDDIALWLGIGILIAAAVATFVSPMALADWGSGFGAKLAMLLIGLPMYICASASTPFAAALLLAGISPGTVLVFLLAGPATNAATILTVWREFGKAALAAYLVGISVGAVGCGVLTDLIAAGADWSAVPPITAPEEIVPHWLAITCAFILIIASIRPLRRIIARCIPAA